VKAGDPAKAAADVVAVMSAELEGTIRRAQEQEAAEEAKLDPLAWGKGKVKLIAPDPAYGAIVETLEVEDPKGTYDMLERQLSIGLKRTDYGTVMEHLDNAERSARLAHRLWQGAIIEVKRWEMDNEVVFAAIRSEATRSLQGEKDKGIRAKQITDGDVESRMATIYPDEWRAQQAQRARLKGMVASLENLSELWASRCRSLQTILTKQR
jgi:hypothetical protein